MFDSLKKKLREGVQKLSKKAEVPVPVPKPPAKDEAVPEEKPSPVPKPIVKAKPAVEKVPAKQAKTEAKAEKPAVMEPPAKETVEEAVPEELTEKHVQEEAAREEIPKEPGHEEPGHDEPKPVVPRPEAADEEKPEEDKGRFARFRDRVSTRELTESDIDDFFEEGEIELLQSDVALEVTDSLREKLKEKLVASKVKRGKTSDFVTEAFRESLLEIVDKGKIDIEGLLKKASRNGKPPLILFIGYNGSGKTTTLAKLASWLKGKGFSSVMAAGDTFRAASIEQLEVHGERLGIKVIKHQYGSDSAAVIFDARKYAEKNKLNVVIADTAGRQHTDKNLMDELKKVVRVNQPELKVLVVDSLTGNDAVNQKP